MVILGVGRYSVSGNIVGGIYRGSLLLVGKYRVSGNIGGR